MRKHKGFTLVELVVVVMILGILAAVAAPKLLGTSAAASENGIKQSLSVVRDAIERYAAEHGGLLPGTGDTTGVDLLADLKEYLRGGVLPVCPVALEDDSVRVVTGTAVIAGEVTPTASWAYCSGTGQFICNSKADVTSEPGVKFDEL